MEVIMIKCIIFIMGGVSGIGFGIVELMMK